MSQQIYKTVPGLSVHLKSKSIWNDNKISNSFLVNKEMMANKGCSFFQKKYYMILKHNYKNL